MDSINSYAVVIGLIFGIVLQKNQFCFSGSIKDYILTSSTKRASSVVMAMITAIISTTFIANYFEIPLEDTIYYKDNINYFSIIFGGILFGIGMMLADGCSSRHLVKLAQGDKKSLITIIFVALFASIVTKGIFSDFIILFTRDETLIHISTYLNNSQLNIYIIITILSIILWSFTKSIKRILSLYDGFIVGILIGITWYVTGVVSEDYMDEIVKLSSISLVSPSAKTLQYIMGANIFDISFPVSLVFGIFFGAFFHSLINKKYSFGCTSNVKGSKLKNSIFGGMLMGVGGVLAIGCTVGQGLTGFSTLATASLIAIISILTSAYFMALYLNKKNQLPMCFIFEWDSNIKDNNTK